MGRKLTPKEREERATSKATKRIESIAKDYGKTITKRACRRYYEKVNEEIKLRQEIKSAEKALENLKKRRN